MGSNIPKGAIKNRIIYGLISMVALGLMYVTDVPAFLVLGYSVFTAFGMVTFFGLADRYVWSIGFKETHSRRRMEAVYQFAALKTVQERTEFKASPLGQYLKVGDIESQTFVGDKWVYHSMIGFGIILTIVGIWFPIANRTASINQKDKKDKQETVVKMDARFVRDSAAIADSVKVVVKAYEATGNSNVQNERNRVLKSIEAKESKRQGALREKNYAWASSLQAEIDNQYTKLENIAIDPDIESKVSNAQLEGNRKISALRRSYDKKEGTVLTEVDFAVTSQKILFIVLAIIAPLLVLLMRYLIVYYEVTTGDERNTIQLIVASIQFKKTPKSANQDTPSVSVPAAMPTETIVVEKKTVIVEPVEETMTPSVSTVQKAETTKAQTIRQIMPREIVARVEERELDLPSISRIKNYVNRINTGNNQAALKAALEAYERELNLKSNWDENAQLFGDSSNPIFYGQVDEWVEFVGYKTKKKTDTTKLVSFNKYA